MTSQNFWQALNKPIVGLAPMDGVTDFPFRAITKKYGNPDVVFTEFTSVEGLGHGALRLLDDFFYDEAQRPIIAQIYGTTPLFFYQTALLLCALGFDGIDINMGCPAKSVQLGGAGAALIKTPELARTIIRSVKQAVADWQQGYDLFTDTKIDPKILHEVQSRHSHLPTTYQSRARLIPVSVKTRVGYETPVITGWIPNLLEEQPDLITVHGRTLRQGYSGEASWELIGQAAELIHQTDTLVLGNGDIDSYQSALDLSATFGVDGVLIGRGSFGNPFIFVPPTDENQKPSLAQIALEHAQLYEHTYQHHPKYYFAPMRKHLGWYMRGFPDAKQVRIELFQSKSPTEVENILRNFTLIE